MPQYIPLAILEGSFVFEKVGYSKTLGEVADLALQTAVMVDPSL